MKNSQSHKHRKNPKIRTSKKFAVITLKVEQRGFTMSNASKSCRGNCKQREQSDLRLHCLPRLIRLKNQDHYGILELFLIFGLAF